MPDPEGKDLWMMDALREALINAFAHRQIESGQSSNEFDIQASFRFYLKELPIPFLRYFVTANLY